MNIKFEIKKKEKKRKEICKTNDKNRTRWRSNYQVGED